MINLDIDNLMDKIMYLKDITYDTNFIFGSGNASYNIVKILKQIDYTNSEKVISYSNSIMN